MTHGRVLLLGLLLALGLPLHSESVTRYVAPPPTGNAGRSCATITNPATPHAVIATAQACQAAGDELVIRTGTYTNDLCVNDANLPSGSSGAKTRIVGFPGETATLRVTSHSHCGDNPMINTASAQHWEFDNLTMNGVDAWQTCIKMADSGPQQLTYRNLVLAHCRIGLQGGGEAHLLDNIESRWSGYDDTFNRVNTEPDNGNHGLYFTGINSTMARIHSHHNTGYGLTLSCEGCGGRPYGVTVARSSFHHNERTGILLYSDNSLTDSLIYQNAWNGNSPGVVASGAATIINNTIYGNDHAGVMFNYGYSTVRNNIILDNNEGALVLNGGTGSSDHNICNSGCDMSGSAAALFMDAGAGDFRPASASVLSVDTANQTVPSGTPMTDYAGESRTSGGARDIGAFEYVTGSSIPPNSNTIYASATASAAADCFIPEAPGTPTTLAHGLTCLTVPGKVLQLAGGTYTGQIRTGTTPITGGTGASVRTTIRGAPGQTAILQHPTTTTGFTAVIHLENASDTWLHFDNLTLDALHHTATNGIAVMAGSDILFSNLTIRNSVFQLFGIFGSAANVELRDSVLTTAGECMTMYDGGGTVQIIHNTISQCQDAGFSGYGGSATVIFARNTFHHTGLAGTYPALHMEGLHNATMVNNIIYASHAGIRMTSSSLNTTFYHNTVVGMTNYGLQCDAGATGTIATNNISVGNGSSVVNLCGATLSGNLTTGSPATIFVNPAANDYHLLAGSPAINTGTNLPAVTTDIDGTVRPQGPAWDAGADEFEATPAAPTLTITTPTSAATYDTTTTPLTSLGGTASDDVGVTSVTWTCPTCTPTSGTATCGSCGATATSVTWTVESIGLTTGANVLTVTPHEAGGPGTPDTLTVTKTDPPPTPTPGGPAMVLFFY